MPTSFAKPSPKPDPDQRSQFYGRRASRKLNASRIRALEDSLPRHRVVLPETGEPIAAAQLFDAPYQQIWLEIGFGGGEHLLRLARAHPDIGFIGCEPFLDGLSKLLVEIEQEKLTNVRLWSEDARLLLNRLAPASLDKCFILFADPWPKKRHHKRRIVNPDTLAQLSVLLKEGSELRLATDDMGLAAWYREQMAASPRFHPTIDTRERPADWPTTRYEQKALSQGKQPFYFSFQLEA